MGVSQREKNFIVAGWSKVDRRGVDRRKDVKKAGNWIGMERRLDDRRSGNDNRRGQGKPSVK